VEIEQDGLASLSLTIGLIVLLLWGAIWALRRVRPGGLGGAARTADCAVVRALALGPRERLLVVKIGAKHIVVGVGAAAVSLLCELPDPLPPAQSAPSDARFAALIGQAMKTWRGA
jgi:flagellar protein FliO/FliZ